MMEKREFTEEMARRVIDEFKEAVRTGNLEKMLACITDDCVVGHGAVPDVPWPYHGKEEVRRYMEEQLRAFSDVDISVSNHVVSGDRLVIEEEFRCTHTGPFLSYAPTGKQVQIKGCEVVSLRDGLVYHDRIYYDLATILRQLGVWEERRAA